MPTRSDPLRVLVAPSGFKECLDAEGVAAAIARGMRRADPDTVVEQKPLADGGEGTAATMARLTGGELRDVPVCGPVGDPVEAHFAMLGTDRRGGGRTAVVELSAAAGLSLVPEDRRDPLRTTSRGVGELIRAALDAGAERIVVTCGDSGVNDGGAGLAAALGVRLLDARDQPIGDGGAALLKLHRIDRRERDPRLDDVVLDVACNMKNVLTGEHGVARLFGPQKGADDEQVAILSDALDRYADIVERDCGVDVRGMPGGGASGGVGAGLHALLGAALHSRFDLLFPYFDVEDAINRADLIVTAEGGVDAKSARGKIPGALGHLARKANKPLLVLAGSVGDDAAELLEHGVTALFPIQPCPRSVEDAMRGTEQELERTGEQVIRAVLAGRGIGR